METIHFGTKYSRMSFHKNRTLKSNTARNIKDFPNFPKIQSYCKDDTDVEWVETEPIMKLYSPILFTPTETVQIVRNKPQEEEVVQKMTKNQKRRQKKKLRKEQKVKEKPIDENPKLENSTLECVNFNDTCCEQEYCHHYAYQGENFQTFVQFQENFLNRSKPFAFKALQVMFTEYLCYAVRHYPQYPDQMYNHLLYFMQGAEYAGVRSLNCITCLRQLITVAILLHKSLLITDSLEDGALWAFFYDFDICLAQIVAERDYDSDIAETEQPIENFVYQSLYYYLCNYLYEIYMSISCATGQNFGTVHWDIVNNRPVVGGKILHLGLLARAILAMRNKMYALKHDQVDCKKFLHDDRYEGGNSGAWGDFQENYLNGSLSVLEKHRTNF